MNPIIEKIRKLLALAKNDGSTANEAAIAMRKAISLASEAGVDLDSIPTDTATSATTHVSIKSTKGCAERFASCLIMHHFSVSTLFYSCGAKRVIYIIGFPEQCAIAEYVYVYLVRSMKKAWRDRSNKRLKNIGAFMSGFATAIHNQMPEKFHQDGLKIVHDDYIQNVILHGSGKITTIPNKSTNSTAASYAGYRAGAATTINNAIGMTIPKIS